MKKHNHKTAGEMQQGRHQALGMWGRARAGPGQGKGQRQKGRRQEQGPPPVGLFPHEGPPSGSPFYEVLCAQSPCIVTEAPWRPLQQPERHDVLTSLPVTQQYMLQGVDCEAAACNARLAWLT